MSRSFESSVFRNIVTNYSLIIFYLLLVDTFVSQMKAVDIPNTNTDTYSNNIARAHNINHNSLEVKDVCYFAERLDTC
jgi:hypothetical protein